VADHTRGRVPSWLALTGAALVGIMTATQARVNGALGVTLDDAFVAAFISFASGLVLVAVVSTVLPVGRRGARMLVDGVRGRRIPWWMLVGGAAGALTVATQGLVVGLIGVSLFTVGLVAGQTVAGLVLDRLGFGPGGAVAVTMPRVLGGLLALVAAALPLTGDVLGEIPLWMLVLPLLAGMGVAWQQGTNGRLRQRVGTPLTATLVNFIGGTTVLGVAALVHGVFAGPPRPLPADVWLYLGGALGATYIFLSAALVAHTGVLLLGLGTIAGQLLASIVLDVLWPASASPPLGLALVIIAVALAAVAVAGAPWRR